MPTLSFVFILLPLSISILRAESSLRTTTTLSKCSPFSADPKDIDIYQFCKIFSATNVFDILHSNNISSKPYYDHSWSVDYNFEISFSGHSIKQITLTDDYFGGKLQTSQKWPSHLEHIDLETPGDKTTANVQRFEGVWNWTTFTQLEHMQQISLKNNKFSAYLTNQDWNHIVSMSSLKVFVLAENYFTSNFSEVQIANISTVYEMQLMNNLFFGRLDTTMNGFFSKFPHLRVFVTANNPNLGGHFANLDALSLTELNFFEIEHCQFSGSLTLSNRNISLPSSLADISLTNNSFAGEIDWNIFKDLDVTRLLLSDNAFSGSIDWKILGDLTKKRLRALELDNNQFDGYANFEYIDASSSVKIRLDRDIICDPSVYICGGNAIAARRSAVECKGKTECESTCKCSDGSTARLVHDDVMTQTTKVLNVGASEEERQTGGMPIVVWIVTSSIVLCVCVIAGMLYVEREKMKARFGITDNPNYLLMNAENV